MSVAFAVAWRQLYRLFTTPSLFLPSLLFPLFFFTAFAGGLSRVAEVPGFNFPAGYTAFQFVFVFLQSAAFGGVFTGFSIARDFESGFTRRLFLAAPHRSAVVAGWVLAALGRFLITATIIFGVGLATGMQVLGDGVDLFGLVVLGLLVNLAATLWASGVAMRLRTMQAGPAMQMPVFLALFLAPVYVPLDLLSGWVHAVASVNPISFLLEAGRGFLGGDPVHVAIAFGSAVGLAAAFSLWAFRSLRRAESAA